jgi:hypothetical protein
MVAPDLADPDEEPEPEADTETETETDSEQADLTVEDATEEIEQAERDDVNEATVELTDDDMGGGLFSGVEGQDDDHDTADDPDVDSDSTDEESGDADSVADGLTGNSESLEEAINEGIARLGVAGLTDDDFTESKMSRDDLETELSETFAAFRLGYFGSQCVDQYILQPADGDVSPALGLAGTMLMAMAMMVWFRPDGSEKLGLLREKVGNITGGL